MKEIPILYSTPMVQAKLAGRKTVTRRILKEQPDNECYFEIQIGHCDGVFGVLIDYNQGDENPFVRCPYGGPGDILWAREAFQYVDIYPEPDIFGLYLYKANGDKGPFRPSIHMPKDAARIWEEVVSIRVERLHDITEEDAIKEGIIQDCDYGTTGYRNYLKPDETVSDICAKESYQTLWESINGKGSWDINPWVWVIETKILSTTGRPANL